MLRMVRQQMICIIAPGWRGGLDFSESGSMHPALQALFMDVKVVRFASIAMLPPSSDGQDQMPSLMLELAIEEGIDPYDMLYRLVHHPSGTMWSLYSSYWPGTGPVLASERNAQLLDRLTGWLSIADGGFVGARDRTGRQIEKEQQLLEWTRAEAGGLRGRYGEDRASFALVLAQRAFQNPDFDWAMQAAPRSYWRGKGAGIAAKLGYVVGIFGLWLVAVWLAGALPRGATGVYAWLFGPPASGWQAAVDAIGNASDWVLGVSIRGALSLIGLALLGWLLLTALPALSGSWRRWLENVRRELERPTETWSSWSTSAAGLILGVPFVLAVLAGAAVFVFCPDYLAGKIHEWLPQLQGWKLVVSVILASAALIVLAVVVLTCLDALFTRINRRFKWIFDKFFDQYEDDVSRSQQVHPSIDRCEALLVRETAHMISLTDIRSPNGWSGWWIRTSLRIVTLAGRVFFTEGRLGDAPGIHFGHWHIIEGGRRYLFCSNYDGSFGGYLDDFINGATIGTTLAWRWTTLKRRPSAGFDQPAVEAPRSFPPTRFVIFRGVKCELKFKSYARDSMLPHLYRFDASKKSVDEINLATGLRDALFGERNDRNDDFIMRAIET